jgi:hypothetical protein
MRTALVLLILCLTAWAQSSALTTEHHHESGHCCLLCQAGPLALQPGVTSSVNPIFLLAWLAATPDSGRAHEALVAAGSCRAPPIA